MVNFNNTQPAIMQKLKTVIVASLIVFISFAAILHTACNKKSNCKNVVCLNQGTCNNGICICPTGFVGTTCQTKTCDAVKCQNGGTCKDSTCICPVGYEGNFCEILQRDNLIGTYKGVDTCTSSSPITITVSPGTLNNTISIKGLIQSNGTLIGTMTSKYGFTISGNHPSVNSIPVTGYGSLSGKSLFISYTIQVGGPLTEYCSFDATKQ